MNRTRVLVVDDDLGVLRTLGAIVAQGGYDTVTLSRFEDAKRYIDATPPDLLITDVRLGPFNGVQLVLHMKQAHPDGPVIVLSAYDDAVIRQDVERAGGYYVTKPVTRQQLLDAVQTVLAQGPLAT